MSHHESMQLFHLSSVLSRPRLHIGGWTARLDGIQYIVFNPQGHVVVVPESLAKSAERCTSLGNQTPSLRYAREDAGMGEKL